MKLGSLFTGYAGLDAAVCEFFDARPVWHCDNDPGASRLLAHRWPDVPNHGDITAVDWTDVDPVDVLAGGWPCQPWSAAGKRKGIDDDRALWPEVARAVRALRPGVVVLENVPRIVPLGELARAVGDLAALGYVGTWVRVGADEAGAPHERQRIFIAAADADRAGLEVEQRFSGDAREEFAATERGGGVTADAGGRAVRQQPGWSGGPSRSGAPQPGLDQQAAPDPGRRGCNGSEHADDLCAWQSDVARGGVDWGAYGPAIERWERVTGRRAPAPTLAGPRGGRPLNPAFCEWLMGLPAGWITDVPGLSRAAQLKLAGNGVVPQQALLALSIAWPHVLDRLAAASAA